MTSREKTGEGPSLNFSAGKHCMTFLTPANLFNLIIVLEFNFSSGLSKQADMIVLRADHYACFTALSLIESILCSKFANKTVNSFEMRACGLIVLF